MLTTGSSSGMRRGLVLLLLTAAPAALARTDLSGCVSSVAGASLVWYVPGTGELCEFLDCGGGRAPPKTTVPGCAAYEGTATYSPSYLSGFGDSASATSIIASVTAPASAFAGAVATGENSVVQTVTESVTGSGSTDVLVTAAQTTAPASTGGASSSSSPASADSEDGEGEATTEDGAGATSSSTSEGAAAAVATAGPKVLGMGIAALGLVAGVVVL
ncbi:putative siderophore biosynthesis protein [Eutypa lata UCREL1]|uniref:Putative siderophore biosynthesis protein n=1 Tax=Eutypa lata (strain UCR-EL1) TaxID=1287681 RepID=M7SQV3_EUTLA|nr:putative siderophore biosynthesis protein [Eutypa lata UCREL1]